MMSQIMYILASLFFIIYAIIGIEKLHRDNDEIKRKINLLLVVIDEKNALEQLHEKENGNE